MIVLQFGEALGAAHRADYARFQLGVDTLAPPAFATVYLNVALSTIVSQRLLTIVLALVLAFFVTVIAANALMPVVMTFYNFGGAANSNAAIVVFLLHVVPWLDFFKYCLHITISSSILCAMVYERCLSPSKMKSS